VLLNENATGDIIKFYNAVFIPSVEKVIVEFKTSEADTRPIQDDNTKFLAMASPFKQVSIPYNLNASSRSNPFLVTEITTKGSKLGNFAYENTAVVEHAQNTATSHACYLPVRR
jgi:hypothetical protein